AATNGRGAPERGTSALAGDDHAQRGLHVAVQAQWYLVLTQFLERALQLEPAAVHRDAELLLHGAGDRRGADRPVERAILAGVRRDGDRPALEGGLLFLRLGQGACLALASATGDGFGGGG